MATCVETFGKRQERAMDAVLEELDNMLPTQLEALAKLLLNCRLNCYNYDVIMKEKED